MSKATKRKIVSQEVLTDFILPEGAQKIVKVLSSRGNNLHEVENECGDKYLVSMPTKFRKNVWIKRGDFIMVEPIEEGEKVRAEIVYILYKEQIKYIKEEGMWPQAFSDGGSVASKQLIPDDMLPPSDGSDDEYGADQIVNVNRPNIVYEEEDSDEESD